MKRCKNCVLWRPYKGNEPTMPRRSAHACMLRLIEVERGGEFVQQPTLIERYNNKAGDLIETAPGPHYRKRTGPNFACDHFAAKKPPLFKAQPVRGTFGSLSVNNVDTATEVQEDVSQLDTPASTADDRADTPA